jgi:CubicO group peptidase (beta-lactamase class C family)
VTPRRIEPCGRRLQWIVLIALIALVVNARAQVPLPQTVAGTLLNQFLEAFNSGNRATLRDFLGKNVLVPDNQATIADVMTDDQSRMFRLSKGWVVGRIVDSSPAAVKVLVKARATGMWSEISLFVTAAPPDYKLPAAPYQIVGLGIAEVPAPPALAPGKKLSDIEIARRTAALMKYLAEADAFSGTVLIARNGKPIYAQAFGLANRIWNIRNRIDTRFNLASITKMFTAVAVAQLVEAGKLSYEDTLAAVLPAYPNKDVAQNVTIHQLLSHTSGLIGARALARKGPEPQGAKAISEWLPIFVDEPLASRPGQRFDYSNAGYMLLGAIIEKASGQNYYEYVRQHVFRPAGMMDTDFYELDKDPPDLAEGFMDGPRGSRLNNALAITVKGGAHTGAYSTGADMVKFHLALTNYKLLNEGSLARLWTGVTEDADSHREYGYGADVEGRGDQQIVGHGGGWLGITNKFEIYPRSGLTVVILSNIDSEPNAIAYKIREWLTQGAAGSSDDFEAPPHLRTAVSLSPASTVGAPVSITVTLENVGGTAHASIVDLEILDASGSKVNQQVIEGQKLHGRRTRTYRFQWTPSAGGEYSVNVGVFGPGWTPKLRFDTGISSFAVR